MGSTRSRSDLNARLGRHIDSVFALSRMGEIEFDHTPSSHAEASSDLYRLCFEIVLLPTWA
jgi:hypothetical protein